MSASVVGALRVNLGLDSAQFQKGLSGAQKNLASARKQFLAVSAAGAAAFATISAAALKGAADIDKASKSARRLDSSVGGFRALELAAGEAGVSVSTLTDAVQTMDREISKGSKGAQDALQKLNLTASQLEGLDADQKMALIADSIQGVGLTTAQTSVVLQELGVRNREMVLALGAGGNVFRSARRDIESYGLAISRVDSDAIEKANDQIGRLGLISQYAGQQLAIALVPAMGRLAEAMTDSLREGGLLRTMIDGLVSNLDVFAVATGAAVAALGAKVLVLAAVTRGVGAFSLALGAAQRAVAALLGPVGLLYIAIGAGAAAWIAHRNATDDAASAMTSAESAAGELSIELTQMAKTDLPNASKATVQLANDNLTLARSAFAAARAQNELAIAALGAADAQLGNEAFSSIEAELLPGQAARKSALAGLIASQEALASAEAELNKRVLEGNQIKGEAAAVVDRLRGEVSELEKEVSGRGGSRGATPALKGVDEAAKDAAKTLSGPLTSAVDGVANAFADFMLRGFRDFKSFAAGILDSFKRMLAEMIATAAKNRIMISLGMGGSIAGTAAQAGGGLLGAMGSGGGLAGLAGGSGLMGGLGNALGGGFAGALNIGANAAAAGGGALATIGAAIPVIGAVALAFGAFRKTTKTLDTGLRVTVKNMDALVETFKKTETSRFFGLSKSRKTRFSEVADSPLAAAVNEMQTSILDAARVLGVDSTAFEDFSYQFRVSLRGLSQEQQVEKINAELAKMGDNFAMLAPGVENMNQLLQQAAQISANVKALTDTQGLFATRQDAVFAASQAGNQRDPATLGDLLTKVDDLIRAVREGDVNQSRLLAQSVNLQQRAELAPT